MSESNLSRLSGVLLDFCKADSLSEEGLREIIERHGLTHNNHVDDSDYAFFRAACDNERITEEIFLCLLEYFPDAVAATNADGMSPLHYACNNDDVSIGIVQRLIDAAPDSVRSVNKCGHMPLHFICDHDKVDDTTAMQILKLLIEKYPEAVRHVDNKGYLPINYASGWRSPEFCRVLIETYPGSERIVDVDGALPLHNACSRNTLPTVEYLYRLYPDATDHEISGIAYPIHLVVANIGDRDDPVPAVEIVKFLLDHHPSVKYQKYQGLSLLHAACTGEYDDPDIDAAIEIIEAIYDALPEAIEDNHIVADIHHYRQQVQAFINDELVYTRQSKNHRLMMTPDYNGQLPLHKALQNNVRLGSIKLLVKGNPSAIRSFDDNGITPLHVACQHHDSTGVVQYLIDLNTRTLRAVDYDNNTALHHACRGTKYDTIALLLESYDAVSVSKRNVHEKLPIDLLWESIAVEDRESVEYMESVFRLLRAYPETLRKVGTEVQSALAVACPSQSGNGKKRKFGHK